MKEEGRKYNTMPGDIRQTLSAYASFQSGPHEAGRNQRKAGNPVIILFPFPPLLPTILSPSGFEGPR